MKCKHGIEEQVCIEENGETFHLEVDQVIRRLGIERAKLIVEGARLVDQIGGSVEYVDGHWQRKSASS